MELPVATRQDAKRWAFASSLRARHRIAGRRGELVRYEDLEAIVPHSRLAAIAIKNREGELLARVLHHQVSAPAQRAILAIVREELLYERDPDAVQVEGTSIDPGAVPVIDPLERALHDTVAARVEAVGNDVRAERLIIMARRRVLCRLSRWKIDPATTSHFRHRARHSSRMEQRPTGLRAHWGCRPVATQRDQGHRPKGRQQCDVSQLAHEVRLQV